MRSAVLFLVFNRPELTRESFAAISAARPPRLYVAADGPRPQRKEDAERCRLTRELATAVTWPCEVKTLFRNRNLGCKRACASAISWFFRQEPEGIILEDDCVAHPDFFPFCDETLARYREEPRVMLIGGSNFQYGKKRGPGSYYFSLFPHIWGWASWASAWKAYDPAMADVDRYIARHMAATIGHAGAFKVFLRNFLLAAHGVDDTWDFQLVYSIWKKEGLCVIPNANLIRNIGNVPDSAHARTETIMACRSVRGLGAVRHPDSLERHVEADQFHCEMLAAEPHDIADTLLREGVKRLREGDTQANHDLLAAAKAFFGPSQPFSGLEALNAMAEGDLETARAALGQLRRLAPDDSLTRELGAQLDPKAGGPEA